MIGLCKCKYSIGRFTQGMTHWQLFIFWIYWGDDGSVIFYLSRYLRHHWSDETDSDWVDECCASGLSQFHFFHKSSVICLQLIHVLFEREHMLSVALTSEIIISTNSITFVSMKPIYGLAATSLVFKAFFPASALLFTVLTKRNNNVPAGAMPTAFRETSCDL